MSHSPENNKYKAALHLLKQGRSVIPVGDNKKSLIKWEPYQHARADEEQIRKWWTQFPHANIGVVTGEKSGMVGLDVDIKNGVDGRKSLGPIPTTACVKTPSGGMHYYFKHPGVPVATSAGQIGEGLDMRGDGAYVVVPPSKIGGVEYEWIVPLEYGVAEMPKWLLDKTTRTHDSKKWQDGINGVPEGKRNETAASMAGKILSSCHQQLWEPIGWEMLKTWNLKCPKPLVNNELRSVWDSIKKRAIQQASTKPSSQADQVIELVTKDPNVVLFHDEFKVPFIQFQVDNHKEYWPCKSNEVRMWLSMRFWQVHKKSAGNDAVSTALNTIQAMAKYQGKEYPLSNRVAFHDGDLYYSLSNKSWENVRITKDGWSIESESPILFRRYTHQAPQVHPTKGGGVEDIFRFINIKEEDHKRLFLVWKICSLIPGIPHPAMYLHGPQGAAKSTTSRLIKKIIDPSLVEVSEIPKDQNDLIMKLSHNWCLMFDNVSSIPPSLSDILCRAITGSGFSKRELYSDDSDVIYNFQRCISINGINLLALKPDLLERSILIGLERISKKTRKNEHDLMVEFERALPGILGGMMDVLSRAMSIRPTVNLDEAPRMADFAVWGYAIAEALGYGGDEFLECYDRNIDLQHEEVIGDSLVASFVVELMERRSVWEGSATDLLNEISTDPVYGLRGGELPKNPQSLSRMLNEIKTNLEECGIKIELVPGQKRRVIIKKVSENIADIAIPSQSSLINDENV